MLERENWLNIATFPDGEYKSTGTKPVGCMHLAWKIFNFAGGYGISLHNRTIFYVLRFKSACSPPSWAFSW